MSLSTASIQQSARLIREESGSTKYEVQDGGTESNNPRLEEAEKEQSSHCLPPQHARRPHRKGRSLAFVITARCQCRCG